MNQVGLVGRVTRDPVLRQLSENRTYTTFNLAINRNFKNSHGTVDADFVSCVAWGRLAERIVKYCGKGSLFGVNGRLHSRTYINGESQKMYTTEVAVEDVRFYALKTPEAVNTMQRKYTEHGAAQEIPAEFVLPEQEEQLPIGQV
ncbi:single-stranded DNA-binding protein [Solibacillus sp. R5-41]|uniref:single-stranded DNA-binding protein n=1 Tax=Solibacillus sp. R5-41 TaxID=2048654 RepID=UPI000C12765C|nr:single-stranded DNA-binding protein [Solibacillus sp. R5-41]ATP38991.1 single-stranded DNA-binding protein [Solibacillus sp. R5-41]